MALRSNSNSASHRNKNQEIEALRGLAIVFAVSSHLGSLYFWGSQTYGRISQFVNGSTGVDLFYCISGYVIARSILDEVPSEKTSRALYAFAVPFWIRRFWRVTPSAWVWIAVTVCASFVFNSSGAFGSRLGNISDAIAIFFQVANVHFFQCRTGISNLCAVSEAYWSLSVEEQFYIVFPFLLFFLPRRAAIPFFAAVALAQLFIFNRSTWTPSGMIRTDGLALGVLIAFVSRTPGSDLVSPDFLKKRLAPLAWSCLWLGLTIVLPSGRLNVVPFSLGLAVISCAVLVWTASFDLGLCFPDNKFRSFMSYVGSRSYAIYLIHIPVFLFINELAVRGDWPAHITNYTALGGLVSFLALILVFALAEMNYRWIEAPLRAKGVLIARRVREDALSLVGEQVQPARGQRKRELQSS
jgi:peptidoglycan/LPS O-acetylase OafA/YrhL